MIATVLFAAAAAAAASPPPAATPCSAASLGQAGASPAQPKRLDQLPSAALHLAVIREINGCYLSTVVANRTTRYVPLPGRDSAVPPKAPARAPHNP